MRKLETDWYPDSNVKVEKWVNSKGNIEYRNKPVSFDGWTRTQTKCKNMSTVEIGRQKIAEMQKHQKLSIWRKILNFLFHLHKS